MFDRLTQLVEVLLMLDDTPDGTRRWRMTVGVMIIAFMAHVLWALGYGEKIGMPGFVRASDLREVKEQIATSTKFSQDIQVRITKKSILDTRTQQCSATEKRYFTTRLTELTDDYFRLTGREFAVPSCEELK